METIRTIDTERLRMEIWNDPLAPSPRQDDNLGTIWTWERGYRSPDTASIGSLHEFVEEYLATHDMQGGLVIYLRRTQDGALDTVTDFMHSGACGVMFVTPGVMRHEYGDNLTTDDLVNARKVLYGELAEYNAWATGNVYGFTLYLVSECRYCDAGTGEHNKATCTVCDGTGRVAAVRIDTIGGFYGDDPATNGMLENMRDTHAAEIRAAL